MIISKIKKIIKSILYWFADAFLKKNGAVVLMYHSISNNGKFFTVKPEDFERQMSYLRDNNFNVVSLSKLLEYLNNKMIPPKTIIITFDDGYKDNYLNAFSVLKKYNFPATIFLITGKIGLDAIDKQGELQILNWSEILEMKNSGLISFEPHTKSHKKLNTLLGENIIEEILLSKNVIEQKIKKQCLFFAYPFGKYDSAVKKIVEQLDFIAAFSVNNGMVGIKSNVFELERNSIDSAVDFTEFKKIIYVGKV